MSYSFYKGYSGEGDIKKSRLREIYARMIGIEKTMAAVAAFLVRP